jgi:arylsulfatase A-like enzyme
MRLGLATLCLSAAAACVTSQAVAATVAAPGGGTVRMLAAAQQSRPNVVMITVDDMRADDLRFMPSTRRLIADRGVSFRNSFAPFPLCCPARSSVLTGRYSHNHGVFGVTPPYGFSSFEDRSTLATWLRRSGYATTYLGKYLNGYGERPEPGRRSGKSLEYVPPGWGDWRASIDGGLPRSHPKWGGTYAYFNTTLSKNGRGFTRLRGEYQSTAYGRLSADIIGKRAASDRPFFLFASYTAPHVGGPVERDDPDAGAYDGGQARFPTPARPNWVKGWFDNVLTTAPGARWPDNFFDQMSAMVRQAASVTATQRCALRSVARQRAEALYVVDRAVRRTISALARSGELDDTLVVFTSDNGYFLGEQRQRLGKQLPYDASLRVPVLVRGPGIPAGQKRYDPFLSIDFAPTIAEFAGVRPPRPVDGVSLLDVARRGDHGWTRPVVTDSGPLRRVVPGSASDNYLRVSGGPGRGVREAIGLRTDRYLYVDVASGEEEMYDMATDPQQSNNLIDDLASSPALQQVHDLLRAELARVATCEAEECSAPMPAALSTLPGESVLR